MPESGASRFGDGRGFPVGLTSSPYVEQEVSLKRGDRLYLYSDGLLEATDGDGAVYGADRLSAALTERRGLGLAESVAELVNEVVRWSGPSGPRDDVSVLAVELDGDGMVGLSPEVR